MYIYVCMYVRIYTDKQHLLAVGDQTGTLHILEVPWTLRHPSSGEVSGTLSLNACTFLLYVQHLITWLYTSLCYCARLAHLLSCHNWSYLTLLGLISPDIRTYVCTYACVLCSHHFQLHVVASTSLYCDFCAIC